MIVKVCGIQSKNNINQISKDINMVGLNFYKFSARYVVHDEHVYSTIPSEVERVGVFVNEDYKSILSLTKKYKLDYAQLHGDESIAYGASLAKDTKVIKVFRIKSGDDLSQISDHDYASYYLFDTHTAAYGGSGLKFDWKAIGDYDGNIPFLLSGGIGQEDVDNIMSVDHPLFKGVDINSKFESSPGEKNMNSVYEFINQLYKAEHEL